MAGVVRVAYWMGEVGYWGVGMLEEYEASKSLFYSHLVLIVFAMAAWTMVHGVAVLFQQALCVSSPIEGPRHVKVSSGSSHRLNFSHAAAGIG